MLSDRVFNKVSVAVRPLLTALTLSFPFLSAGTHGGFVLRSVKTEHAPVVSVSLFYQGVK